MYFQISIWQNIFVKAKGNRILAYKFVNKIKIIVSKKRYTKLYQIYIYT